MTLGKPLEDLVAPDRAMVLTVLERAGQPLTGRTIATLTGTVSQSTTSRLLIDLVRRGLVLKVPGGYEINRDHLAFAAVAILLGARDELQRRVTRDVEAWDVPPLSVVLFGSAARGGDTVASDIDLLVVRPSAVPPDEQHWADSVANLARHVSRWCGSPCEVLEYSPDELAELRHSNDPLVAALMRDGITFAGTGLDQLLGTIHA